MCRGNKSWIFLLGNLILKVTFEPWADAQNIIYLVKASNRITDNSCFCSFFKSLNSIKFTGREW